MALTPLTPAPTTSQPPEWLDKLLKIPFYAEKCIIHKKQYNTMLCCACMEHPLCSACWKDESHQHDGDDHPVLRVRIGSERACIKEEDIGKFIDTSEIHRYRINRNIVLFLNPNKPPVPDASHNLNCLTCQTILVQDRIYNFCSIACKFRSRRLGMETEDNGEEIVRERVECKTMTTTTTVMEKDIGDQCCSSFTSDSDDIDYTSCSSIKIESSTGVETEDKGEEIVRESGGVKCKMMKMMKRFRDQCCSRFRKRSRKGIPHKAPSN